MRTLLLCLFLLAGTAADAQDMPPWRSSTPEEQRLDAIAFEGFDAGITGKLGDIQSVVVVLRGRTVYEYYRDGDPDTLRDVQSVTKSALAVLVGTLLQQGKITSLDQPVVELMPEWQSLNADARARTITLRHLMAMTPGFEGHDVAGTTPALAPATAWARPLRADPGQQFFYDNSVPLMVSAILERVTGQPIATLVREQLVTPLAMREPTYARDLIHLRTVDMAKLGYLLLQDGRWAGQSLMPAGFAAQLVKAQSAGGPPVGTPYGLFWWVPSETTFFASGYGGQAIWVHAPLGLVVAVTSTVSPASQHRPQALGLIRGRIFQAAQKRSASSGP